MVDDDDDDDDYDEEKKNRERMREGNEARYDKSAVKQNAKADERKSFVEELLKEKRAKNQPKCKKQQQQHQTTKAKILAWLSCALQNAYTSHGQIQLYWVSCCSLRSSIFIFKTLAFF